MSERWAQRLAAERTRAGLSLRQLGQLIGVSFSTLARIERGEGVPDRHTQRQLHRWLDPTDAPPPCRCRKCLPTMTLLERVVQLERQVAWLTHRIAGDGRPLDGEATAAEREAV